MGAPLWGLIRGRQEGAQVGEEQQTDFPALILQHRLSPVFAACASVHVCVYIK